MDESRSGLEHDLCRPFTPNTINTDDDVLTKHIKDNKGDSKYTADMPTQTRCFFYFFLFILVATDVFAISVDELAVVLVGWSGATVNSCSQDFSMSPPTHTVPCYFRPSAVAPRYRHLNCP